MIEEKIQKLIDTITASSLTDIDKESLIQSCLDIKKAIQTMHENQAQDIKYTHKSLSDLEKFELNHPTLTHCIDILARTLSRLGV